MDRRAPRGSDAHSSTRLFAGLLLTLASCTAAPHFGDVASPEVVAPTLETPPSESGDADNDAGLCPDDLLRDGGELFMRPDGTQLWYELAGPDTGDTVLILHGGPGANSRSFKHSIGAGLEKAFRVLYVDQRGCGRSRNLGPNAPLGMRPTLEDIDALRRELEIERVHVLAHSFGGVVAVQLAKRYPKTVDRLILVDTLSDVEAALAHQLSTLAAVAAEAFPEHDEALAELVASHEPSMQRLGQAYQRLGRERLQGQLHYATDSAQRSFEALDAATAECTQRGVAEAFAAEGWLTTPPEPPGSLGHQAVVFAGRHSEVIGEANIRAAADAWGVPIVWFENSGHFVYWEEPQRFVEETVRFLNAPAPVQPREK